MKIRELIIRQRELTAEDEKSIGRRGQCEKLFAPFCAQVARKRDLSVEMSGGLVLYLFSISMLTFWVCWIIRTINGRKWLKIQEVYRKMEQYKQEFIEFMVESDVLKFGEFTLKSGRKSPFFMNAGAYVTGSQLMRLGEYYAKAIHENYGDDFDVLFGPAYKGIPISVVTAVAYSKLYGKEIRYCSDRKEEKDHGADKGGFLGSSLKDGDRVVMIEDVTTSGKSMEETVPKVKGAADVEIIGLMVSLNRMEKGLGGEKSALDEIKEKYGFDARAIVTMEEVVEHLYNRPCQGRIVINDDIKAAIDQYYEVYGCR